MTDNEYLEIKASELNPVWNVEYVNGIESNPIDYWWTVIEIGNLKRRYEISPYHKCDVKGLVIDEKFRYFALYEILMIDNLFPSRGNPVAIYEDLESAKERAKYQILSISSLISAYFREEQ